MRGRIRGVLTRWAEMWQNDRGVVSKWGGWGGELVWCFLGWALREGEFGEAGFGGGVVCEFG